MIYSDPEVLDYFTSTKAAIEFHLNTLSGKERNKFLKMDKHLYYSKDAATNWYNDVKDILLEDFDKLDALEKAITLMSLDNLTTLYNIMIR